MEANRERIHAPNVTKSRGHFQSRNWPDARAVGGALRPVAA
jgi:hypothetical protein